MCTERWGRQGTAAAQTLINYCHHYQAYKIGKRGKKALGKQTSKKQQAKNPADLLKARRSGLGKPRRAPLRRRTQGGAGAAQKRDGAEGKAPRGLRRERPCPGGGRALGAGRGPAERSCPAAPGNRLAPAGAGGTGARAAPFLLPPHQRPPLRRGLGGSARPAPGRVPEGGLAPTPSLSLPPAAEVASRLRAELELRTHLVTAPSRSDAARPWRSRRRPPRTRLPRV